VTSSNFVPPKPEPFYNEVVITGYGVRLPQASGIDAFWQVLMDEKCVITEIGADRFSREMFYHPDPAAKGKTYSVAAGQLDNIWEFDAAFFGISPREAEQMDPQQRLLLEVTAEALAEAGLTSENWDRKKTGVFVGASSSDYSTGFAGDPDGLDAQFMLGNTLSVISNRLAYYFDLKGPSYTVDTACSSSLFALDQAVEALRNGKIETAIVGAVNLLISPIPFVGFSRASMLSADGLCKAFDKDANGYVRSEGAVVFVLRRMDIAHKNRDCLRAVIHATAVNSDGRTVGMSMPSSQRQQELLQDIRAQNPFDLNDLAFLEAHGTGTPVGDPVEANAIGNAFAASRGTALPIGSAKSNFGHLEPASGLVGMLKAVLALEKGVYPASLHINMPNPHIDFEGLNLSLATKPIELPERKRPWLAGVNSFGFGGANAHVVLRQLWQHEKTRQPDLVPRNRNLLLSANSKDALQVLAQKYHDDILTGNHSGMKINNAIYRRERHSHSLVALGNSISEIKTGLKGFLNQSKSADYVFGQAKARHGKVGFVFSGNGAQWPGMGRHLYQTCSDFRDVFDKVSDLFSAKSPHNLRSLLFDKDFESALGDSPLTQPLAFAIQVALSNSLVNAGLTPQAVMGHSAGEVPAAYAAGIISLTDAVHLVRSRSAALAGLYGKGAMAAVLAGADILQTCLAEFGKAEIVISAENSSRSCSISGPLERLKEFAAFAKKQRIAVKILNIPYPFHSPGVDQIKTRLLKDIAGLSPVSSDVRFYSSSSGQKVKGDRLNAEYWWHNTRNPVLFRPAIAAMVADGFDIIVEIGPKSILRNYVMDSLENGASIGFVETMSANQLDEKLIAKTVARALVLGAKIDWQRFHGPQIAYFAGLPLVPWQKNDFRIPLSIAAIDPYGRTVFHPLLGSQVQSASHIWHNRLDPRKVPWLADHVVDASIVFPATGFVEMALAAGQQALAVSQVELLDLELLRPVVFDMSGSVDFRTRFEESAGKISIETRKSHGDAAWEMACFATVRANPVPQVAPIKALENAVTSTIYADLAKQHLTYGPEFALVQKIAIKDRIADAFLGLPAGDNRFCLDPRQADAALHGIFALIKSAAPLPDHQGRMMVPKSFGKIRVFAGETAILRSNISLKQVTENGLLADISLCDAAGVVRAQLLDVRLITVASSKKPKQIPYWQQTLVALTPVEKPLNIKQVLVKAGVVSGKAELGDAAVLLDSLTRSIVFETLGELAENRFIDTGNYPANGSGLLESCLGFLAQDSLATAQTGTGWQLAASLACPDVKELQDALLTVAPTHIAELQQVLFLRRNLKTALQKELLQKPGLPEIDLSAAARWRWQTMANIAYQILDNWPDDKRLNILLIGPLETGLCQKLCQHNAVDRLVVSDFNNNTAAQKQILPAAAKLFVMPFETLKTVGEFDIILSVDGLATAGAAQLATLSALLAPAGNVLAIVPERDAFSALYDGLFISGWDAKSLESGMAIPRKIPAKTLLAGLEQAGFEQAKTTELNCPDARHWLVSGIGSLQKNQEKRENTDWHLVKADGNGFWQDKLNIPVITDDLQNKAVVFTVFDGADITATLTELKDICLTKPSQIMVICSGQPALCAALRGWLRVAMNEFPDIPMQTLELAKDDELFLDRVHEFVSEPHLILRKGNLFALRILSLDTANGHKTYERASVLEFGQKGQIQSLKWQGKARLAPTKNQVEIAVEHTGLNFRDVMWTQGLLPAEALENGYVGATLGMECAGKIIRAGADSGFSIGDRVIAFSPAGFSSHVTVDAAAVASIPDQISTARAASLPVAFLTAIYGLQELAKLSNGETVLIHGGAGGVGLAAMQVALKLGATVIATAGTPEKRQLLQDMGAKQVFDSRSLGFSDAILQQFGGVDVVLNSLSGEAMHRSIECLKPFGRFVELGKRDFFANTRIGLRAFRKNLSYFGVDADQLLAARPDVVSRLFTDLKASFETGEYTPPPCQIFKSNEVADAFRLMQKSGHIGKIVVQAPDVPKIVEPKQFKARDGWLIIGGTGGLGRATAQWLAQNGAKKLWLVSRSGKMEPIDTDAKVEVIACDAASPGQMQRLFDKITKDTIPLRGVIHSAMVLEDGLIRDATAANMAPVLDAKIAVGQLLDQYCHGLELDHFIAFSSISTFFGNPGQSAYVAGNSFLEGLVQQWQQRGQNATCVAFGPVSDHGYLADKDDQRSLINKQIGGGMMDMAQALDALSNIIPRQPSGVVAVGAMAWGNMVADLKLLRTPFFDQIDFSEKWENSGVKIDLKTTLKGLNRTQAIQKVIGLLRAEASEVLRQPTDEIDPDTPLTEMGFDSLMAMSLRMQADEKLGIDLPIMALVDGLTLTQLAHKVLDGTVKEEGVAAELVARHITNPDLDPILVEKVSKAAENISRLTKKAAG